MRILTEIPTPGVNIGECWAPMNDGGGGSEDEKDGRSIVCRSSLKARLTKWKSINSLRIITGDPCGFESPFPPPIFNVLNRLDISIVSKAELRSVDDGAVAQLADCTAALVITPMPLLMSLLHVDDDSTIDGR